MKPNINLFWIYGILALIIIGISFFNNRTEPRPIGWPALEQMLVKGDIDSIGVLRNNNQEIANIFLKKNAIESYKQEKEYRNIPENGFQFIYNIPTTELFEQRVAEASGQQGNLIIPEYRYKSSVWPGILSQILLLVVLFGGYIFIWRRMSKGAGGGGGGGIFNVGKAKAQMFDKENSTKVTFKDVAGLEEAKVEIMEIVDFLKKPEKYKELGGKIPKGALLVGPPGTGKTLLAKAVAGEANVPFFSISGSDFVEMFVGVGASRVRDLFRQAKEKAPCIVIIDEIDAIGRARSKNAGYSSNDERENTLNQLLTEMDGFGTNSGVIMLAATNRADILDKALLRAGRFDRQIEVGLPELNERREIFDVHLRKLKLAKNLDRDFLAKQTPGFSGADIANVCNEAALIAARNNKSAVDKEDFLAAIDRIVGGLERRSVVITPEEKRVTAYHEAGHATVSWMLEHANPLIKVTIIPRGRSLGAAWYLPDERHNTTREQFMHEMAAALGGRLSEEIFFDSISTGAISDLEKVTKVAYAMVTYYGMSDEIGNISYYDSTGQSDMAFTKPFSEQTAQKIDAEAKRLITEAQDLARKVIEQNREGLCKLAELLLEREVIFTEDVENILGRREKDIKRELAEKEAAEKNVSSKEPKSETDTPEESNAQKDDKHKVAFTLETELTEEAKKEADNQ